jgi:KDO2-lipid IV(A) lauroyltransferase
MMRRKFRHVLRQTGNWLFAQFVILSLRIFRLLPPDIIAGIVGRTARLVGPMLPRSRVGEENLRLAFPEKSDSERREILRAMWDNLARTAVEYVHLDRIFDFDPEKPGAGRIEALGSENFTRLREDGKPAIIFTGHLANWELLSVCAAKFGLETATLFRPPNNRFIADRLLEARDRLMSGLVASRPGAVYELSAALGKGGHVGLLVDQKFRSGIPVCFFGRPAKTNPLLAKLARRYDCPVHGARTVRLPNGRFRLEISDEIDLPRDASGHIDVEGATARVTEVVEGWVREHPEQWLWVHRRWEA